MKIFRWMVLIVLTLSLSIPAMSANAAATPVTVVSILRTDPSPTIAASVNFTVTFSEAVKDVDTTDFNLTRTGSLTGGVVTGISGGPTVYTVSASTGTGSGTLRLNVAPGASITSVSSGTPLSGLPYTGGESYAVRAPSVAITRASPNPTTAASVDFTVTFSEAMTDVSSGDFTLTKTGTLTGVAITGVSGGPAVYTVSVNTGTGFGTLRLDIPISATITSVSAGTSVAGLPYSGGESYTVRTPSGPTVVSSVLANPDPTSASSVDFTVTFSEAVTGVGSADFSLTTTGTLSGAAVTGVSGGPTVYKVSASTGTGSGTLRLDIPVGATVASTLSGVALAGLPYTGGASYTVDKTNMISIRSVTPNPTIEMVISVGNGNPGVTGVEVFLSYNPALVAPATTPITVMPDFFGAAAFSTFKVLTAAQCPGGAKPCIQLVLAGPAQTNKTESVAAHFNFTTLAKGSACFAILQSKMVNADGFQVGNQTGPEQCVSVQFGTTVSGTVQRQGLASPVVSGKGTPACSKVSASGTGTLGPVTANANGGVSFVNPPAGTYTFRASYPGYLDAVKTGVSVPATPSDIDLGTIILLGGDINKDGVINILDVQLIINKFGQTGVIGSAATTCTASDEPADINDDGAINISDLAITAGNFGKVAP
jgi:hypothetical protein